LFQLHAGRRTIAHVHDHTVDSVAADTCLEAANARAMPVLIQLLRSYGQDVEVQLAVWRPLLALLNAQPFLRKLFLDHSGMKLVLAGISAHQSSAEVLVLLCLAMRTLLPATPPRPFVEAGGLELLCEAFLRHKDDSAVGEVVGACLRMLAGVNNIVRRMILRMRVVAPLLTLVDANAKSVTFAETM